MKESVSYLVFILKIFRSSCEQLYTQKTSWVNDYSYLSVRISNSLGFMVKPSSEVHFYSTLCVDLTGSRKSFLLWWFVMSCFMEILIRSPSGFFFFWLLILKYITILCNVGWILKLLKSLFFYYSLQKHLLIVSCFSNNFSED